MSAYSRTHKGSASADVFETFAFAKVILSLVVVQIVLIKGSVAWDGLAFIRRE